MARITIHAYPHSAVQSEERERYIVLGGACSIAGWRASLTATYEQERRGN